MSYQQTLDYLYSRLPMFSRVGSSALKKDLTNTIELCKRIGNPQNTFKTIHVGGTNGKGSVSHMLAAILQQAGYKTGLYTSPHLKDFRERIRVNGEMIPEERVIAFTEEQKKNIEEIEPSFFELTVAMAFQHFAREKVDIAIIEVGLGGRLDSTNIITPLLSVITNISYDHVSILGNTLPLIATEKAGIIKPGVPVVIGEKQDAVSEVFLGKASENNSPIVFASEEWNVLSNAVHDSEALNISVLPVDGSTPLSFTLDLTGTYQLKNIKTVLSAVKELQKQGLAILIEEIARALSRVKELTGLMGRWQTLSVAPLIICDTGHNEDGIKEVLKNIHATAFDKLHMVIGMVRDKDISSVLALLPKDATYYFCQPSIERAMPAADLAQEANIRGLEGRYFTSVTEALSEARFSASEDDMIFIGGSTFVVAEIVP
ncbi:dihydrofolate synthase/folylpolyglutamate synthase [Arcticibacter tournemirensis]|uniref:Dihydrofolate synthase/folylpolyglutamate synthase n=1 Tax=Arcticibacter tournemirensis TaxID=699437 RepID=A0A4V1KIH7_9SPHI|nr:folylpolyglutamate synthase/dihydrofolate synthase family protein [Arcticibacter tournemirensis]KAA8483320.1 bifunctional folylpolyglutamate synthase/dihydrofolate synthase [Arcticibacter tournemirensis]RXF70732.1 bifunctional folylpolyglutamate synthase/dihydrofolate synthase [Arcticibacter tournemirensis]TQM50993.1 dihydrofolate synthase/folylpolyglutamate synthase [Arcticibacter tournemirensis]